MQALRRRRAPVAGAALAEELGVSLRTLYRDIASLKAQGAAIEGEAGFGYVLKPGFTLPPLMFNPDEVEALALGRALGRGPRRRRSGHGRARRARQDRRGAAARARDGARLALPCSAGGSIAGEAKTAALPVVRQALARERKLAFAYADKAGCGSNRVVWPVAVGFFDEVLMLAAWCETRQAFRHFRLDRMTRIAVVDERPPRARRALFKDWQRAEGIAG